MDPMGMYPYENAVFHIPKKQLENNGIFSAGGFFSWEDP